MKILNTSLLLVIAIALVYLAVKSTFSHETDGSDLPTSSANLKTTSDILVEPPQTEPITSETDVRDLIDYDIDELVKQYQIDISSNDSYYKAYDKAREIANAIHQAIRSSKPPKPKPPLGLSHVSGISRIIEDDIYYIYSSGRNFAVKIPKEHEKHYINDKIDHNTVSISGSFKFIKNITGVNGFGGTTNVEYLETSEEYIKYSDEYMAWRYNTPSFKNDSKLSLEGEDLLRFLTYDKIDSIELTIDTDVAGEIIDFYPMNETEIAIVTKTHLKIVDVYGIKQALKVELPSQAIGSTSIHNIILDNNSIVSWNMDKFVKKGELVFPDTPIKINQIAIYKDNGHIEPIIVTNNYTFYQNAALLFFHKTGKWFDGFYISENKVWVPSGFDNSAYLKNNMKDRFSAVPKLIIDPNEPITSLARSNDYIAVGTSDGDIIVYDKNYELLKHLEFDTHKISAIEIIDDYVLAGGADWSVMVWDIKSGTMINRYWPGEGEVSEIKFYKNFQNYITDEELESDEPKHELPAYVVIKQTKKRNNLKIVRLDSLIK